MDTIIFLVSNNGTNEVTMSQSKGPNRMKDYTLCLFNCIMNKHNKEYTQFVLLNKQGTE